MEILVILDEEIEQADSRQKNRIVPT